MTDLSEVFGATLWVHSRAQFRGRTAPDGGIAWLHGLSPLQGQLQYFYNATFGGTVVTAAVDGLDAISHFLANGAECLAPSNMRGLKFATGDRFSLFAVLRKAYIEGYERKYLNVTNASNTAQSYIKLSADGLSVSYVMHYDNGATGADSESSTTPLDYAWHLHEIQFASTGGFGALDGHELPVATGGAGVGAKYADVATYTGYLMGGGTNQPNNAVAGGAYELAEVALVMGAVTAQQTAAARAVFAARYPSIPIVL